MNLQNSEFLAFGPLGGQEIFLIFIVILLLFGAKKLPELARGMGKSLGEFKKAKDEFEHEIMTADQDAYHDRSKPEKVSKPEEEIASAADTNEYADHSGESESDSDSATESPSNGEAEAEAKA
jgi:sec-independent protein translocase protein TatA